MFLSTLEEIVVPKPAIRILLVEDNDIVRMAQTLTLQEFSSLALCDYAVDGLTAVQKAKSIRPQVILMDIGLPGIDGIEATALIKAEQPECRIVIVTTHNSEQAIFASLAAGADAFCLKDIAGEKLAEVIQLVADGAVWLDPRVAATVLSHCIVDSNSDQESASCFDFGVDGKFVTTPLEYGALYHQSRGSHIDNGQPLLQEAGHSQMLRRLFSRMVKRRKSACDR